MPTRTERLQTAGFGRSQASKAVWEYKTPENPFTKFITENRATDTSQLLVNYSQANIQSERFTKYILNINHEKGKNKAIAFRNALGYTEENKDLLIKAIREGLQIWKGKEKQSDEYGKHYEVSMLLDGVNGKRATVKTGWIIDNGKTAPRLTSAYVYKSKGGK